MTTTQMEKAVLVDCVGLANPREHMMRDNCWSCAPYWEHIPTCPRDGTTLRQPVSGQWFKYDENDRFTYLPLYCRVCHKHYDRN